MRRWAERLGAGYSIRRGWALEGHALPRWRWELVNPEGAVVQTVRSDTVRKLGELGLMSG